MCKNVLTFSQFISHWKKATTQLQDTVKTDANTRQSVEMNTQVNVSALGYPVSVLYLDMTC